MVVLSSVGWSIGAKFGMTSAFILSSVGTFAGIYIGWKIARDYF